jgi:hypothetical protein
MGKLDTCQYSLHSFSLTPAAATNKTSANSFQRVYKRRKLNTEITATYKYCSYLVTCLVYSSQLNYIHFRQTIFDEGTHAPCSNITIMCVLLSHSNDTQLQISLLDNKWAHLYPFSLSETCFFALGSPTGS